MTAPGAYHDIPFEQYRKIEAVSNSSLGPLERSPLHYLTAITSPQKTTDDMLFGALAHCAILEPDSLDIRYAFRPAFEKQEGFAKYQKPKATKEYRRLMEEWEATNTGKVIVDEVMLIRAHNVAAAVRSSGKANYYLCPQGQAELTIVWRDSETGLLCKGRLDHWEPIDRRICDLKTCRDVLKMPEQLVRMGYARQAAFYLDGAAAVGLRPCEYCLIAVESWPPHGVMAAPLSRDAMGWGRERYQYLLKRLLEIKETKQYRGYSDPVAWELPPWAGTGAPDGQVPGN
jgi:exodeoxyribonuclease VIII